MDKPNRKQNPRRKRLQPLKRTGRTQFHRAHIPELINSPIPAPGLARLRTWSSTAHERHLAKSSSHFLAGEPGSSPGSRRTPSQGGRGECSNCVLILRFRKLARACKAVHRACEQYPPSPTPKLTRDTTSPSSTWKQGQRPPARKHHSGKPPDPGSQTPASQSGPTEDQSPQNSLPNADCADIEPARLKTESAIFAGLSLSSVNTKTRGQFQTLATGASGSPCRTAGSSNDREGYAQSQKLSEVRPQVSV